MKVLCIDNMGNGYKPDVVVGDHYHVVDEDVYEGIRFYEVLERPPSPEHIFYDADFFIPLSDIDEKELIKGREEVFS